jgi:hypothetical protein
MIKIQCTVQSNLLTTCTYHSELQVITGLLLTSTIHRSPQHMLSTFPVYCVFTSHSLAMVSSSEDSSSSVLMSLLSSEYFTNELLSTQLNSSTTSSQPTLQSSTQLSTLNWTLSFTNQLLNFTSLNWTAQLNCLQDSSSAWTTEKTPLPPSPL